MAIKLDQDKDQEIDVADLEREFKRYPALLYGWSEVKAGAEEAYEIAKATHDELRSQKYLDIRSREGKITEATLSAQIDVDPDVRKALRDMLSVKRDYETIRGYVDGIRAKKDCLVNLSADARKE